MNISDLTVTQIRIFSIDAIPTELIGTKSSIEKITATLSISECQVHSTPDNKNIAIFRRGELKKEGGLIAINRIEIEPRRIVLEVKGSSEDANQVLEALVSSSESVLKTDLNSLRRPLLLAETTRCIAKLDFTMHSLFNPILINFLNGTLQECASNESAKALVKPLAAVAEIGYQITDRILTENNITMNPKQFNIAAKVPLEDKQYIISSPFDSNTHVKLIEILNNAIASR